MSINELEAKASTYRGLLAEIKQLQDMADAIIRPSPSARLGAGYTSANASVGSR